MLCSVCLVRHGEAFNQIKEILCGDCDAPLTPLGREQARRLGLKWNKEKRQFSKTYVSTVNRCLETLECIKSNNVKLGKIMLSNSLREINVGNLAKISYKEFLKHPNLSDFGIAKKIKFPFGESFFDFRNRVIKTVKSFKHQEKTLVIAHTGVINVILHWQKYMSWNAYPYYNIKNCDPIEIPLVLSKPIEI